MNRECPWSLVHGLGEGRLPVGPLLVTAVILRKGFWDRFFLLLIPSQQYRLPPPYIPTWIYALSQTQTNGTNGSQAELFKLNQNPSIFLRYPLQQWKTNIPVLPHAPHGPSSYPRRIGVDKCFVSGLYCFAQERMTTQITGHFKKKKIKLLKSWPLLAVLKYTFLPL